MLNVVKRYISCFLIAAMLVGMVSFTNAEAALSAPRNCRFAYWSNSSFTACKIKWNKVSGANKYNVVLTYTDNTHYKQYTTSSTSYTLKNLKDNHVYKVKVNAIYVDPITGQTTASSNFSNTAYIVPLPRELKMTISNSGSLEVKLEWNKIYGSSGYNVFLCTENPDDGDWLWNSSASSNSAKVKVYNRKKLKKYETYYIRIVTRKKINGKYASVYVPSSYYNCGFQMMYIR